MRCPYCHFMDSKVIDSRVKEDGETIRRRRQCISCGKRFTTREQIETPLLLVVKTDGRREPFDREKLKKGIIIACAKRSINLNTIEGVVQKVEVNLRDRGLEEIDSKHIGELVISELKKIDEVAYVRFASVYRNFRDKEEFIHELNELH